MSHGASKFPPLLFVALFLVLVGLVSFVFLEWALTVNIATEALDYACNKTEKMVTKTIENQAKFLNGINSSTFNLAWVLGSTVKGNLSSFATIEKEVAPSLFVVQSTIPFLSQVSFIGGNGNFYSYLKEGNQTLKIFSNVSLPSSSDFKQQWYQQAVDSATGTIYGDIIRSNDLIGSNSGFINLALQSNTGCVSLVPGLGDNRYLSFLFTAPLAASTNSKRSETGVVALGISMDSFVDYVFNMDPSGGGLYLAAKGGRVLSQRGLPNTGVGFDDVINVDVASDGSCKLNGRDTTTLTKKGKFKLHCTRINLVSVHMISMLVLPYNDAMHHVRKMAVLALSLLLSVLIMVSFASYIMFHFMQMYQRKETFLNASLVKQKEATQQAERKSMNKSLAFARASHDVRNSLNGITELIKLSRSKVPENPEMIENLDYMSVCSSKLLDILNSVLDFSKVEAGKMHLEEVEFDMAQAIEESVDMFHLMALQKGVEVIWDPCDCSVLKNTKVKGDCRRFKQILDNLLSNAVKFTCDGHVVVRAWAKKTSMQNSKPSCNHFCRLPSLCDPLSRLFCKDKCPCRELNSFDSARFDPASVEFTFEVDDTGLGIPNEKRSSVFENYVQVKEPGNEGHQGTGLGLGIVQSFVRLMGGDISILDKMILGKGTCFRFNIFLKSVDAFVEPQLDRFLQSHQILNNTHVNVALMVQGEETRRISQRLLEKVGAKVWNVNFSENFNFKSVLEKIRQGLVVAHSNASGIHKIYSQNSPSYVGDERKTEGFSAAMEQSYANLFPNRRSPKLVTTHALIIIDAQCGPLSEMYLNLKSFAEGLHRNQYKIIWLVDRNIPSSELTSLENELTICDLIQWKPFHGSRLRRALELMQEFGGTNPLHSPDVRLNVLEEGIDSSEAGSSIASHHTPFRIASTRLTDKLSESNPVANDDKTLNGLNVLVVEDHCVMRLVTSTLLRSVGAKVSLANNGQVALDLVQKALVEFESLHGENTTADVVEKHFHYDLILMDCEMDTMNGYEATRRIRIEEERCGVRIPIIATTAHEFSEHGSKSIEAGMDYHLTKPLEKHKLLDAIHSIKMHGIRP